jgi:oligopeptide transport system substrate-binding protein
MTGRASSDQAVVRLSIARCSSTFERRDGTQRLATIFSMTCFEPARQSILCKRPRAFSLVITLLVAMVILLAACESQDAIDDASDLSPVTTPGDVPGESDDTAPRQIELTPEVEEDIQADGWTILTGRDRQDPPENRSSDQVFRMAGASDPPASIDPALVRDTESAFLARQVFRGLVRLNAELEPVPDLAQQVEISPDGRLYRFTLHENITFHDGTPITAERVKASFERATDPALMDGDGDALPSRNYLDDIQGARERMRGERDDIPGIRVVDDLTIEFELEQGVVDFLERLANPSTLIVDVEEAYQGGEWWQEPNGSGPFRLTEWDRNRQFTLEPHDGYVLPPALARVEIRVGAEAVGQMQQYETEQIDMVGVSLSVLDRVQYEGSPIQGELREEPLLSTSFVMINSEIVPYDDQALRQAIAHAIPRDQITEIMLDGRVLTAQGIIPPAMDSSEIDRYPFDYDPDQARMRYEESDGLREIDQITIYSSGGSLPIVMKQFIEEELGLPVEVVVLRWSDYMADMDAGRLPVFVLSWVADGPDPVSFMRALFHSESPDNYARFSDEEVDRLLDQAAIEPDEQQRMAYIREAHERILQSAVVVPLYHGVDYLLVADHVRGLNTTPMGILGLETVWIDD